MSVSISDLDKILVLAALPEDVAVACGGFISKYRDKIDVLCINMNLSDQDSVQVHHKELCNVGEVAKVNRFHVEDFCEPYDEHFQNCISQFNMKDYDVILVPNKDENGLERKFVSESLLKAMLEVQGCKNNLQILRYEVWTPFKNADYYEDITDYVDDKKNLILSYKTAAGANFAESILSMNKFRTFTSGLSGVATHVEAYCTDGLSAYLEKPDIINEITDKDFKNEEIEKFLAESDAQAKIDKLAKRFSGKKIAVFCADEFTRCVFKNYDLSKLNIIAIADKRFEQNRKHEFYGLNCIKPQDLKTIEADVIIISELDFIKFYDILVNSIIKDRDIEVAPLIKTDLNSIVKGDIENKVCARPFHELLITPTGHCITCCPAYIKNFVIGNVLNNDVKSIWNGTRAKYLRNALMNDDYTTCDLKTCIQLELRDKSELSEYFNEDSGDIKMPDTIFMGWDYDCNVACITCRNEIIKNNEQTLKGLEKIEQNVLDACKNVKYFYASGNGDPFGSSYARNLIKKVAAINPQIKFYIHTNGILCTPKMCDELGITDRIKSINFSIHAACKETYDKIVRYGNYDKVIENLEWISSLKREGKIDNIIMVFVVHKLNYKDMPDFVRLAEKYDAVASFRYYRQWANNTEYNYDDMAVYEKTHPEYSQLVAVLQDEIFNSPNCSLDPSLNLIRNDK